MIAATIFAFACLSSAYELIAAWPMDEGSGDVMHDSSGNGHDGEFFGNPEWTNGKFGKGIQLTWKKRETDRPASLCAPW